MEVLERDSADYRECAFLRNALGNGWLVSDLTALSAFYQAVQQAPKGFKSEAEFYLQQIASMRMDKLIDSFETLNRLDTCLYDAKINNSEISALHGRTEVHPKQAVQRGRIHQQIAPAVGFARFAAKKSGEAPPKIRI